MANLQFVVTAVFNNTQLREGTEELKSTFSDLNHLNNSTLNTSNKQINKLQSEINDLIRIVDNIENRIEIRQRLVNEDKIELEVKKSDLEELQKSFGFLLGQVALNIAEDAKDARDTLTKRQISPNQIEDIIRANDPRNDINEIKALTAAVQLLIATQTKNSKERSLESNIFRSPRGPASNTRPLTSEERTKLLNDIAELDLQIHDLLLTLDQNISERIQRQFPDAFAALEKFREIRATQNEIGELETGILGTESKINQDKEFLEEVLRQLSSVQQKRDELGETFFPEIDLGIDEDTFNLENLSFPQMKLRLEPIDQKQFQEEIENTNEKINEQSNNFGILEGAIASADGRLVAGAGARSEFLINTEQTAEQLENEAESINNAGSGLETLVSQSGTFVGIQGQLNQKVGEGETALEGAGAAAAGYVEETKNASQALDSLGVFVGKISAQISETFSDFLFEGLKGNFDNFEDLFDDLMDTLLRSFTDFASAIITNPIRVSLEGSLKGDAGGGGIGGLFKGIGDALGPLGDLFKSGGPLASIGDFFGDLFAEGGALSFLGDIGSFLGPIGSAISAVASIAIPLIGGLLKKTPRLDLDFDQFRDEFGNSLEIAAEVQDFLNEDLFRNEIFNNSVSRQAGLGLGSELPNVIREAIEGQINAIQDIINQLPADLAAQLNESLLNTSVDIESEVKGDRLLEFDETKNIQEKFQQFINGDLQARFLFSIRDFFVGAFESLGVLGSAAQDFIDAEFEKFQGLSREERIEAGEELLQDFQTLTDAFNVLNNNGADSIGATVNSIKNLSSSLEFDGVPSIEELDAGLEELINAAELDPDVIQDYLDLRNAILEAQRAILSSISSIISSISSLNSIIVDGGGDAFDLTGFINDGLDSVTGLLGQDGLSVEDREELLGLGTGFLDQLIAEEQAAFQAQLEATQQAAEAAAEAQRSAVRAQISGLEDERDLIEENFDARLEALEEELRIAEEFARLTESIKQTLDSIILGPDSVFTAVERLNIVQGDIASLQSELAATTDPSRQLELAGQLEDSLSTLFDLAGEAFGVNSPEFVAIFDQVTGGLNDLLDLTGNRERSVEEINAEIEALNVERNAQLEAIDAQIESLNEQLSSIQAENVDATFQASDRVQELAEFFRNEYITLLEERFAQLGEVSETGFTQEIDALNNLVAVNDELKELGITENDLTEEQLIVLRDMQVLFREAATSLGGIASGGGFIPEFMNGSGGIQNFGNGTLALLHGNEAVLTVDQINDLIQSAGARIGDNVGSPVNFVSAISDSIADKLGSRIGGNVLQLDKGFERLNFTNLFGSGRFSNFLSDVSSGSARDSGLVEELAIKLDVNINSNSPGVVDATVNNIEDMLVRSIRQGGKLRSAVQEAGAKRFN